MQKSAGHNVTMYVYVYGGGCGGVCECVGVPYFVLVTSIVQDTLNTF